MAKVQIASCTPGVCTHTHTSLHVCYDGTYVALKILAFFKFA